MTKTIRQLRANVSAYGALALALALLAALLAPALAQARPGDLDRSFGGDGKVKTQFGSYARAVAIDSRGRILAGGGSGREFELAGYERNGRLDRTFSGNGKVATEFAGSGVSWVHSVAIDARRRIVAAGSRCEYQDPDTYELRSCNFALARYKSGGTLDPSFGVGGKVTTDFGGLSARANSVAIDARGRIVTAGDGYDEGTYDHDFVLARYKPNGSLDPSFGTGGKVTTDFGGFESAYSVAIDPQARIVAAGDGYNGDTDVDSFLLARYLPKGSLDPSFGYGRGWVTTEFGYANAVAIDSRGRTLAAGGTRDFAGNSAFALARYNSKGVLAGWFGQSGQVTTHFGDTGSASAISVAIDSRGRFVAVGNNYNLRTGANDFALARYHPNGSLDRTFSGNGKVTASFGRHSVVARSAAIDSRDRIVVAGGHTNFVLARFIGYRRR